MYEIVMFAVGHLSLGYLFAKGSAKLLKQEVSLPHVFLFSLLPDIDIIIPWVEHRTITHSITIMTIAFLSFFIFHKTKTVPNFIALSQHSLVGDFIIGGTNFGGTQLFWPVTSAFYGLHIGIFSKISIILELACFFAAIAIMLKTKDMQKLLEGRLPHLSLSVPTLAVLLPAFFSFPLSVPAELLIPHFLFLIVFALSMFNVFKSFLHIIARTRI